VQALELGGTLLVVLKALVGGNATENGNILTKSSSMTFCHLITTHNFLFLCVAFNIFSLLLLGEIYAGFLLGGHQNIDIYLQIIKHACPMRSK
jgi:hypothetical protein